MESTPKLPPAAWSGQALQPSPDLLWRRLDDEVILMQIRTDRIFSLNQTGARFWELIVAGMDLESIRRQLESEFDVSPEVLAAEVEEILALLISEQLLIPQGS
jgi:hypothetical protein